jgi:DNA-binding PadR family transcriptional regulator
MRDQTSAEIKSQIRDDAAGLMLIKERSFYAALATLAARGQVERYATDYGRVFYRLNSFGRRLLKIEQERLYRITSLMKKRLD